jgi:hypothetical protein
MEFSLIHAGLAAGAALAALPVILHLFMRQTPKHVIFPAMRLVRERQKRSRKRLRVKNWLLLLARMALLALMALALARPRLYSQVPLGDESVPTALGLVFDTSLSMGYKEKDKTRLDEAKERARAILDQIPDSSLVFVVDSHDPIKPNGLSPGAARKRIDELTIHAVNRPLNSAMGQVYPAVAECDRPRHEVYVLTDLAKTSWKPDQPAEGLDQVEKAKTSPGGKITTFILRLGVQDRHDVAIDAAEPARNFVTQGESVEILGRIHAQGDKPAARLVEFYLDGVKKGEKPVEVPPGPGSQVEVSFATPPRLEGEIHRGELRLSGTPDPLEFNDRRYFTFKMRPAYKVLLIRDQESDAEFVAAALDPDSPGAPKTIQVDKVRPAELVGRYRDSLRNYASVFLLNVATLDEESWGLLNGYVHEGGGLVVGLGDRCSAENYNGPTASQLLPAQLDQVASPKSEITFGKIADVTHPLFQRFAKEFEAQLALIQVYRYWRLKPPPQGSRTLMSLADGAPALVERSFKGQKTGRVQLWTTPLARRVRRTEREAWNDLPNPIYYVFPIVMNLTVPYLAGTSSEQLNWEAGENVLLSLGPGARFQGFLLTGPDEKTTESLTPSANSEFLEIVAPQVLGQYKVMAKDAENHQTQLGFSLNPPRDESKYIPLEPRELDTIFGKDGYRLAEDAKTLKDMADTARYGYEIFPWLMILILIVVTLENVLANTFYKESPRPATAGAAA